MGDLVLVTGASGYIATHVVQQLIKAGYQVRGTVRSLKNEAKVKPIRDLGASGSLDLVEADLLAPAGWPDAVRDCKYVMHLASPFPIEAPDNEDELIKPAVDGTLNVLKACAEAKTVKRVVLTSSIASVAGNTGAERAEPYTEKDWSDPTRNIDPYAKSKTLAEKAAWDYIGSLPDGEKFELAVINPGFVLGPVLCGASGTSQTVIKRFLERQLSAVPNTNFPVIDVRDVAAAHIAAMKIPEAVGNRHLLTNGNLWFREISEILSKEFKSQGYNPPTSVAPYCILWMLACCDKSIKGLLPNIGKVVKTDNSRLTQVLKISPIDMEDTVVDMAYSMIEAGQIKKTAKYRPRENATN